jgi:hypothetical protein
LDGVQLAPDAQVSHEPLLQTWLGPHPVPLGTGVPVSSHKGMPLVQLSVPVSHTLVGVHAAPAAQAVQVPVSHTMLVPQEVPLTTSPMATQTAAPVEQSVIPSWQRLVGVQAAPDAQATQAPLSQTSPDPHDVPLATGLPVSAHSGLPDTHDTSPVSQALVGVQLPPDTQVEESPASPPPESAASAPESEPGIASTDASFVVMTSPCASIEEASTLLSPGTLTTSAPASVAASSGGPSPDCGSPQPPAASTTMRAETPAHTPRRTSRQTMSPNYPGSCRASQATPVYRAKAR